MNIHLAIGLVLLAGLIVSKATGRIKLPSVTSYLILGIVAGPYLLNLVSRDVLSSSAFLTTVALSFVAFALGESFSLQEFRRIGKSVLWISILGACVPWILVTVSFWLILKQPLYTSLLFGAISSATAPAATVMVIRQYKAKGIFTNTLMGVVAIDDAWCIIIFAVSLAVAKAAYAHLFSPLSLLGVALHSLLEIFGAMALGGVSAWLIKKFSGRIRTSTELLTYVLGFILFNAGLATYLHLSVLLTNMFMGVVLVNIDKESTKFFESLHAIDSPIYLLFFVFAGASLEIDLLTSLGITGMIYVAFRSFGKMWGASMGGYISTALPSIRKYLGLALLPQAGVALGLALIAKSEFPQIGGVIITTIVATTVIYELVGPLCTKIALQKAGETNV